MQNINKRAISSLIGTVLIVFLSISLVGVLSGIIIEIANKPKYSPESSCFNYLINPPIEIKSACYNPETNDIEVSLSRKVTGLEINDLTITATGDQETEKWACMDSCGTCTVLQEGERKKYFLSSNYQEQKILSVKTGQCELDKANIKIC